jgi:hypothetical protein
VEILPDESDASKIIDFEEDGKSEIIDQNFRAENQKREITFSNEELDEIFDLISGENAIRQEYSGLLSNYSQYLRTQANNGNKEAGRHAILLAAALANPEFSIENITYNDNKFNNSKKILCINFSTTSNMTISHEVEHAVQAMFGGQDSKSHGFNPNITAENGVMTTITVQGDNNETFDYFKIQQEFIKNPQVAVDFLEGIVREVKDSKGRTYEEATVSFREQLTNADETQFKVMMDYVYGKNNPKPIITEDNKAAIIEQAANNVAIGNRLSKLYSDPHVSDVFGKFEDMIGALSGNRVTHSAYSYGEIITGHKYFTEGYTTEVTKGGYTYRKEFSLNDVISFQLDEGIAQYTAFGIENGGSKLILEQCFGKDYIRMFDSQKKVQTGNALALLQAKGINPKIAIHFVEESE